MTSMDTQSQPQMSESKPPPPGIYVPAVLFFKEDEELDEEAIKSHVLRLAQVSMLEIHLYTRILGSNRSPPNARDL